MAGYLMTSFDGDVFQQLTTSPTFEQAKEFADAIGDMKKVLKGSAEWYGEAANPALWPLDKAALAEVIRKRLAAPDWYADCNCGDAAIWTKLILDLHGELGKKLGIDVDFYDDAMIWWNAAMIAERHGAPMMAEPRFGGSGFRYSGHARSELEFMYSLYLPPEVQELLRQLEKAAPYFELLPDEEEGDRDQFFRFLMAPVRDTVERRRVLCIQTDT
jgi:hypothetical protein